MQFNLIDMDTYPRREHYVHYSTQNNCTHSVTANVDITAFLQQVRERQLKFYPAFIHIVTMAVNATDEFKMAVVDGKLGGYDEVSASYLIFHDDDKTFSCAYTKYNPVFADFYKSIIGDMEKHKDTKGFVAIESPENCFPVSCFPWLNYSAMNLNMPYCDNFYAPIITWGKYQTVDNLVTLPLTVQINHAVADGYHTSMFYERVQTYLNQFNG